MPRKVVQPQRPAVPITAPSSPGWEMLDRTSIQRLMYVIFAGLTQFQTGERPREIMEKRDDLRHDSVDRLEAEWRKKHFGFSAVPLAVGARIQRAAFYLEAELGRAAGQFRLSAREFMALSALWRSGVPFALNPMQLLEEYLIPAATLTRQIDRLESLGLVKRKSDPSDRRSVLVQLTNSGKEVVEEIVIRQRTGQKIIERMSRKELQELNRLLHRLLLMFEEETTLRSARPPSRRGRRDKPAPARGRSAGRVRS
jgi:DNA-binding MarR family transcriptional regulator